MESDRPPVLNYEPPPQKRGKFTESFNRILWFVWGRPLRALEVAVAGMLLLPCVYVFYAPGVLYYRYAHPFLFPFSFAVVCVTLGAILRVFVKGSWAAASLVAVLFVVTGPLTGLLQLERCPHAVYLQVVGINIPIWGDPCNNPRDAWPWWMRE